MLQKIKDYLKYWQGFLDGLKNEHKFNEKEVLNKISILKEVLKNNEK